MTSDSDIDTVEEIVSLVDKKLQALEVPTDVSSLPTLACDLCEVLGTGLSAPQIEALRAARLFLDQGMKEGADSYAAELSSRVGKRYPPDTESSLVAKERLLWIALNRVTPFSDYALDFTLGVAEDAGVKPVDMVPAVHKMLARMLSEES